jgi:hypothetical protein
METKAIKQFVRQKSLGIGNADKMPALDLAWVKKIAETPNSLDALRAALAS